MSNYNNFIDYLNINYKSVIIKSLKLFLIKKKTKIDSKETVFDDCKINSINVLGVNFKKSELEKVEFDCYFKANYTLVCNKKEPFLEVSFTKTFLCYFKGSFRNGFKLAKKEIEVNEEEIFEENLTKKLVPIISKDQMDNYATKFLKYFCCEALKEPTKLNLKRILNNKGIYYYFAPLVDNVYGKIYFTDDVALIYDKKGQEKKTLVKRGTILLNKEKEKERGKGALRNTIVHEAVHWYFHGNYFELRQLLDKSLTCAVCYKADTIDNNKEIEWMERQARFLTPKILMPKKQVLEKYKEFSILLENEYKKVGKRVSKGYILQQIVGKVADFFGVSKISAKYRLIELGMVGLDGVFNYNERIGRYYLPYSFDEKVLKEHQTFHVSEESLVKLLQKDNKIRNAIIERKIIYVNGLLVVNNPKYINNVKNKLTEYALENVHECCIILDISFETISVKNDYLSFTLYSGNSSVKLIAQISTEQLSKILKLVDENSIHYEKNKRNLPLELGETIEYHCKKSGFSYEGIAASCDINEKTLRNYRKELLKEYDPLVIIKFGLGLKLSFPYIQDLLEKADRKLLRINPSNNLLLSIISTFSRVGIDDVYKALKEIGKEKILNLSIEYLKNNNLL